MHSTTSSNLNAGSKSSSGKTWTMRFKSPWSHNATESFKFRSSKLSSNLRSLGSGNGRETFDGGDEESMRPITIIQGVGEGKVSSREGGLKDGRFELEERGATPSSAERDIEGRSAKSLGFRGGR
jgi:hypothetical protein